MPQQIKGQGLTVPLLEITNSCCTEYIVSIFWSVSPTLETLELVNGRGECEKGGKRELWSVSADRAQIFHLIQEICCMPGKIET